MDDEDFLAAVEADNANTPAEEPKAETPEEPKAEEPKAEPEAPVEPEVLVLDTPAPEEPEKAPVMVPIGVLHEVRDELKTVKADLAKFQQPQSQPQPTLRPDPYEDPEGAADWDRAQVGQALYQTNLRWSERIAKVEHGAETVDAAKAWGTQKCDTDPFFNAKVAASEDPIGFVVAEYKREEIASKVNPSEFAEFQAWKAAQGQLQQQPGGQPPPPNQPSAIPKPSLASAPSAGSILTEVEPSEEDIFGGAIPKR